MAVSKLVNLKTQRLAAGLSIEALAKKAGVNDFYLTNAEANGGTLHNTEAAKVAAVLGVTLTTLGQQEL